MQSHVLPEDIWSTRGLLLITKILNVRYRLFNIYQEFFTVAFIDCCSLWHFRYCVNLKAVASNQYIINDDSNFNILYKQNAVSSYLWKAEIDWKFQGTSKQNRQVVNKNLT